MVKVGFIVEGTSDFIIIKSESFQHFLSKVLSIHNQEEDIIIARCKSNIKINFKHYVNKLKRSVDYIFILVDQDDKEQQIRNQKYNPPDCPLTVVDEIRTYRDNKHYTSSNLFFIVMTREMEAWFLADAKMDFHFEGEPEKIINPSDIVAKKLGTSSHVRIANKLKDTFSLERAAENAPSAKRFLQKLTQISQT